MTPEQKARIEKEAGIAWEKYCEGLPDKDTPNPYAFAAGYRVNAAELSALREELERVEKSAYESMVHSDAKIQRLESDLAAARKEIEELKNQNRWIPVDERLPEHIRTVIVDGGIAHWDEQDQLWYSGTWTERRPIQWTVTHWQPLPSSPESK